MTHVGLYHEKLFYALKHSEDEDYKHIMKRFYPDKYKKVFATPTKQNENPTQSTEADPQGTKALSKVGVKRKLSVSISREKRLHAKSPMKDHVKSTAEGTGQATPSAHNVDSPSTTVPNSKRVKQAFICEICPPDHSANYNNAEHCQGHMAEAHFQTWILDQYPAKGGRCGFPDCSVTLHSAADRARHLGLRHKQVMVALQSHLLVSNAKKEAQKRLQALEQPSNPGTKQNQKEQTIPLRSGRLSEVLVSIQPQKNSTSQVPLDNQTNSAEETMEVDKQEEEMVLDVDASKAKPSREGEKTCKDCGGWKRVSLKSFTTQKHSFK